MKLDSIIKHRKINNMTPPTTLMVFYNFMSLVNYYHNMWAGCSHLLEPLTNITYNKVGLKWTEVKQKPIKYIKRIVNDDNLLPYPVFNKQFEIHTSDSNLWLGAVISK